MGQIDREATFRGYPVDSGVGKTRKSGLPQWIANLQAVEIYDEETEQWVDWSKYAETEITAYLVLFDKNDKFTLNATQIQKAVGWDGVSTFELGITDYSQTLIQFRVKENTYEGKTSLQVEWIDHADAEPGRKITKLEPDELKKVDAKYAAQLKKLSGGHKPKSVPAKPPIPKPTVPEPNPAPVDKEAAKAAMKAEMEEKAARGKAAEAKATKRGRPPKPAAPQPKAKGETCTLAEAWEAVYAAKSEDTPDDKVNTLWLETIDKYGDQDTLMGEEWVKVRDEVIAEISS